MFKDAGKYSITIDLGRNFCTEDPITAEFTIYKATLNISDVQYVYYYYITQTIEVTENKKKVKYLDLVQYEGSGSPKYNGEYFFFAAKEGTIPSGVTVKYVGTKQNESDKNYTYDSKLLADLTANLFPDSSAGKSEINELLGNGFYNAGTYSVNVLFSGRNYISKNVDKNFTINKADILGVTLDAKTFTYKEGDAHVLKVAGTVPSGSQQTKYTVYTDKNGKEISELGFKEKENAGKYKYIVTITNPNYNTLELSAFMTINKANFVGLPDFVKAWHFKNGDKLFAPDMSEYNAKLPTDTSIVLMRGDKVIEGVNKLGSHNLLVKYSNDNYNTHISYVDFRIVFNPLAIVYSMLAGVLISLLLLLLILPSKYRKDRVMRGNLMTLSTQLVRERGGIVCESIAKTRDKFSRKKGRLYLTPKALEFYDKDFPLNHKNFAIIPKDIIDIKAYGRYDTKLAIITRSGWRKIKVPAGTATMWKNELINFKNVQQAYYSELHILNPDK